MSVIYVKIQVFFTIRPQQQIDLDKVSDDSLGI